MLGIMAGSALPAGDLALRRGQTYAAIFVDLETSRPIDLVEGRDAEMVAAWLQAHPDVEVISRDRGQDYAERAKAGAPKAVQVADRFHLVQNTSQALDEWMVGWNRGSSHVRFHPMLRGRPLCLDDEADEGGQAQTDRPVEPANVSDGEVAAPTSTVPAEQAEVSVPTQPIRVTKCKLAERRAARLARWERVQALAKVGMNIQAIGRNVGISRKTVRRLINSPEPPHNQRPQPRPPDGRLEPRFQPCALPSKGLESPTLRPYLTYLQSRWQAGCTNVAQLFRELVERG